MKTLDNLIKLISRLPGLGSRSARRIALHLVKNPDNMMLPLSEALQEVASSIKRCEVCGNIDLVSPCNICTDDKRDDAVICVVEDIADLWAMDRDGFFKGRYHVLGGVLSVLDGNTPEKLNFHTLKDRVANSNLREIIIATNSTVEGQTTAHYIHDMLAEHNIKITRLAHGIPMGAELDYMDEGTLSLAMRLRQDF